jgi:hypothetical protein
MAKKKVEETYLLRLLNQRNPVKTEGLSVVASVVDLADKSSN